ncbi:hypothetical protein H4R34_004340 [Dimargaris verticillata]|uniref:Uncharacterized protein n=1 Tax=Dimargaris verticillata TaxID=2761393 RepID=A0A9W8B0S7_9FUNG|nr:hypothetical protein H4R34_004340 [Dimargaris verticillata]
MSHAAPAQNPSAPAQPPAGMLPKKNYIHVLQSRTNLRSPTDKMVSPCTRKLGSRHLNSKSIKPKSLTDSFVQAKSNLNPNPVPAQSH